MHALTGPKMSEGRRRASKRETFLPPIVSLMDADPETGCVSQTRSHFEHAQEAENLVSRLTTNDAPSAFQRLCEIVRSRPEISLKHSNESDWKNGMRDSLICTRSSRICWILFWKSWLIPSSPNFEREYEHKATNLMYTSCFNTCTCWQRRVDTKLSVKRLFPKYSSLNTNKVIYHFS